MKGLFGWAAIAAVGTLAAVPEARAYDSYNIVVPTDVMKGDPDVFFTVTPYQGGVPSLAPHNVIITLPSGIAENPLADPPNGLDWSAIAAWGLFAGNSAVPGQSALKVTEALAAVPVTTTKFFNLQNVVRSFEIVAPSTFTPTIDTGFIITIRARDAAGGAGAVVSGFNDDVILSALFGDVIVEGGGNIVDGSKFKGIGEATVTVKLLGTDPSTRVNRLTVTAVTNYLGLGVAAGYADVTMNPKDYDHMVLLFPGENLVPGKTLIPSGKTGAALNATSNVAVDNVTVYLVDAFNNPIVSPSSAVTLAFESVSHSGTDTVPGLKVINLGNSVTMNGEFSFVVGNVSHQLRVYDFAAPGKNSVSSVHVNSGAASLISVGAVASPRTPGQSFVVTASVVDGSSPPNTVVGYPNGRNVNVTLTNCSGSGFPSGTIDTNPTLTGVQTTVNFTNGVFTGPFVVYSKANTACIKFDDGLGNFGESNGFQIILGDQLRLHVVMPGQSFTPGQAPGNAPPVPTSQTAGNLISADVYVVDQGWNVVNTVDGGWVQGLVVAGIEDDGGTPGYVDLTVASPLMPASGNHATVSGVRLRTAYTGGNARLVVRMSGLEGRSDPFTVYPTAYNQMVFSVPGETLAPGIQPALEPDGKTGLPLDQAVNANIPVSVYLTDSYFNPIINPPASGWPSLTFSTTAPVGAIVNFPFSNPFPMTSGVFNNQFVLGTIGANTVRVVDNSPTPKSVNQTINVTPGDVVRFLVTPNSGSLTADPILIQTAGVPFNLTFKAFDQFDNIATQFSGDAYLELWEDGAPLSYAGTISPSTITFVANPVTGGVVANVPVTITYAGKEVGLGADNLRVRVYVTTPTVREGFSHEFSIKETAVWSDIVVTLTGESLRPGLGPPYKTGSPTPATAGNSVRVDVTAVDSFGNRVDENGIADLSMPTAGVFSNLGSPAQVSFSSGEGWGLIAVHTAGSSVLVASVTARGFSDTSTMTTTVGSYSAATGKLMLLAPGETLIPGSSLGKDSTGILPVEANTAMTMQLLACDRFYNIDTTYSGNIFSLSSDDGAVSRTNLSVHSGSATISSVILVGNGAGHPTVRVTAADQSNSLKSSFSDVPVDPGAYYVVTVASSARVGDPFDMTVDLIDPVSGLPRAGANNNVFIEALTSSGTAATVPIGVAVATLNNGSVTFQQNYGYVETIKLRVTDNFLRQTDSGNIDIVPNGLKYIVTLPPVSKTATELFPVTVGLYDTVQSNLPIRALAYQHSFNVFVTTWPGGTPAEGRTNQSVASLVNGVATFNFNYTKAETIIINATGTVAGFPSIEGSSAMTITPGTYVKLQVVIPGENPVRGVPSDTGKDSSAPTTQVAGNGFTARVYSVDQYWNVVNTNTPLAPSITLSASDGSLTSLSTQSFTNGESIFSNLHLRTPPTVTLTARDGSSASLVPQSVAVPLAGRAYVAAVSPLLADYYTGPDPSFAVRLTLHAFVGGSTGAMITDFSGSVTIDPVTPDFQPLTSTDLVVRNISLPDPAEPNTVRFDSDGTLDGIFNMELSYRVAEDIRLRFTDEDGWQGYSDVISFVPLDVDYIATLPTESEVGPPTSFTMTISPRDKTTGTIAKNWSRSVFVTPVSPSGTPVTGVLQVSTVSVSGGATTFQQAFSQAGVFYFQMFDGVRTSTSATMTLTPGPLASMTSDLPPSLEAGSEPVVQVTLLDANDNPIPNQSVSFGLSDSAFGSLSTLSGLSNALGVATFVLDTNPEKSGTCDLIMSAGQTRVRQSFLLIGPPTTSLRVSGRGVEEGKGFAVKPDDAVYIDVFVATGTLTTLAYSVDGGPLQITNGPFTLLPSGLYTFGPLAGLSAVGVHTVEYFATIESGSSVSHQETAKTSKSIFVSSATQVQDGLLNYPNPFRAGQENTYLEYVLDNPSGVTIVVYDRLGQKVWERGYSQGEPGGAAGLNRVSWDGRNGEGQVVGNGGYVAVLTSTAGHSFKRKIAVKK